MCKSLFNTGFVSFGYRQGGGGLRLASENIWLGLGVGNRSLSLTYFEYGFIPGKKLSDPSPYPNRVFFLRPKKHKKKTQGPPSLGLNGLWFGKVSFAS